jgi:hypothetical protein
MGKEVAVKGCHLTISSGGSGPEPTIKSQPSDDVLVSGKGVFFGEIKFEVSGVTAGDIANADGKGEGTIKGTGSNILLISGSKKVVLKDDESASVTVNGTKPSQSGSAPASGSIKVKVSNAGQTDVIAS